jgi:hypothetical protein
MNTRIAHLTNEEIVEVAPCLEREIDHIVDGPYHTNPR